MGSNCPQPAAGKLERSALTSYSDAEGKFSFFSGGLATNEKLEARGFIEISALKKENYMPFYRITSADQAEWLRLRNENNE